MWHNMQQNDFFCTNTFFIRKNLLTKKIYRDVSPWNKFDDSFILIFRFCCCTSTAAAIFEPNLLRKMIEKFHLKLNQIVILECELLVHQVVLKVVHEVVYQDIDFFQILDQVNQLDLLKKLFVDDDDDLVVELQESK